MRNAPEAGTLLAPETQVLMADGRARAAADVEAGDVVYGTTMGSRRRYAHTIVRSHDLAFESACRIELADGTTIVVGRDQPFVTYRGWKYVTGAEQGLRRRPHLTTNSQLLGTGYFERPVEDSSDYRLGYLCGLIRGDGHVGSYICTAPSGRKWIKHGFRLALADDDALERAHCYLADAGLRVTRFVFQQATQTHRQVSALGNQTCDGVDLVRRLIEWHPAPTRAWHAGFLAGIFDAEGSSDRGRTIRICNTDPTVLESTASALRRFHFEVVRETQSKRNGLVYLRIRGGLHERLRFFHLTDPAITRKRSVVGLAVRSAADLQVTSIDPLEETVPMHQLTTSTGDLVAEGLIAGAGIAA